MPKTDPALARMRAICLALPDTRETLTWGAPHFRVGDKIFASCGAHKGRMAIGFKLTKPHAEAVIHDPRFERAPYVGRHGWVSMHASMIDDWSAVRAMIHESYSLIAPPAKTKTKTKAKAKTKRPRCTTFAPEIGRRRLETS
jgi:predicted DNA-binding protein (MmcQ/YjbR family)